MTPSPWSGCVRQCQRWCVHHTQRRQALLVPCRLRSHRARSRAHERPAATAPVAVASHAGLSVRYAEKLLVTAQQHLDALLSATPSNLEGTSHALEAELLQAMDAMAAYRQSSSGPRDTPSSRRAASIASPPPRVVWTATAAHASAKTGRTLADLQDSGDTQLPGPHAHTRERHQGTDSLSAATLPPTPPERRAAMLCATLLHWVAVVASRLAPHQFDVHQPRLLAALVPPTPPPLTAAVTSACVRARHDRRDLSPASPAASTAVALARSLWRRGARAYVDCLVHYGRSPRSAAEWHHLRSVLVLGEGTAATSTGEAAARGAVRSVGVAARNAAGGRASTDQRTPAFKVVSLPFLPSGESWCLRVLGVNPFASQAEWTHWKVLYAMIEWAREWDQPSTADAVEALHISSCDILAVLVACLQECGNQRDGSADAAVVATQEKLRVMWESARAAEHAFPSLAVACGVDKTAHQGLRIEGGKVITLEAALATAQADDGDGGLVEEGEEDGAASHEGPANAPALTSFSSSTGQYHRWAARGRWSDVLRDLDAQCAQLSTTHARILQAPHGSQARERTDQTADVSALWQSCPLEALWRQWPPLRTATVLKAHAAPRLPSDLATAAVTAEEEAMIARPPTIGLDVLPRHIEPTDEQARLAAVKELDASSLADGRRSGSPPLLAVDLRRRLWCLARARLPARIAATAVCFARTPSIPAETSVVGGSPELTRTQHGSHHRRSGSPSSARVFPFVWRVPAKEWLPWYLLASVGALLHPAPGSRGAAHPATTAQLRASVRALQARVWPTLFRPLADYAAFNEHCIDVFVQLAQLQRREQVGAGVASDERGSPENVWADAAWWLFQPSLPQCRAEEENERRGEATAQTVSSETRALESMWAAVRASALPSLGQAPPSSPSSSAVYADRALPGDFFRFLQRKTAHLRNYHVSLALEALSRVDGASLGQLLHALEEEHTMLGPVVMGPESCVAVTTALLLFLLPAFSASHGEQPGGTGESAREVEALLTRHHSTHLYFAVPTEKAFHVSTFFKAIHDPSFLSRCVPTATAPSSSSSPVTCALHGWDGAEALLLGRSLRLVDRFPTTTTTAFFRLRDRSRDSDDGGNGHGDGDSEPSRWRLPRCEYHPPTLTCELFCVDVVKALEHFVRQQNQQARGGGAVPQVVAAELPFGLVAVNKPAGMNCTLHAAYPSLIPFLAARVPWQSARASRSEGESADSALLACTVPALHQHGLVNRIDVGTSGLVLVTDNHVSLRAAMAATLVHHRFRKTYRALVQYVPPPLNYWAALSTWFLPTRGVITGAVYAHGVADPAAFLALLIPHQLAREAAHKRLSTALLDRRPAQTRFRVLEYFPRHGVYHVEIELDSGRRHQIRQHFASIGHPLVGDTRYHSHAARRGSQASWGLDRPALHASGLRLVGPRRRPPAAQAGDEPQDGEDENADEVAAVVQCALPDDMAGVLARLRGHVQ